VVKEKNQATNSANMELKNANPNGGNVVASNVIKVGFYFLEILKIEFRNRHLMLFF
jgi:hypothetical protein